MNTYKVFGVDGKTLRFCGHLISTVESMQIETPRGGIRFELNAYDRESRQFVITISVKRSDSEIEEVFDFYNTDSVSAAEDFLYDFDPAVILHRNSLPSTRTMQKSPIAAADHAYYAATRRLIRELNDHVAKHQRVEGSAEPAAQATGHSDLPRRNLKIMNRIRDLFGI